MKTLKIISGVLFMTLLFGCNKVDLEKEDHFFVSNDDASMPVYVRGDLTSDVILLFLHGGPGGNASQASFLPSFQQIEETYAVAYWDQRASGLSQGNPNESTYNVDQFVEDTYYVVQSLKTRYPSKSIFILGHSWGGALGSAFLSTSNYQQDIAGFICMNSGHNLVEGLPLSVIWVRDYAIDQINGGNNVAYWEEVKNWCETTPDMTDPDNYFKYVEYLKETDAYRHDNQEVNTGSVTAADILNSRLGLGVMVGGAYLSQNFNILELNLSNEMGQITIPSLVLWGAHDGVNTIEMGFDAFNSLGTPAIDKNMIVLQNSAHEGYLEEPGLFVSSIVNFIAQYQ